MGDSLNGKVALGAAAARSSSAVSSFRICTIAVMARSARWGPQQQSTSSWSSQRILQP